MSEWTVAPLDELAEISSGGTPSRANPVFWGGNIPWVTPSDITVCKTNYLHDTADSITEKGLASSSAKLLREGTLLLTSRATIGEIKIASRPVATNQGFKNIAPKSVDGNFLFYQLVRLKSAFARYAAGSTFLEINRKDTGRVQVPYPKNTTEQRRIALVLQTVDRAIESTEALIEKYQQIKAGLMHDLFTRGIGADGKLRPPREQAPELYQQTPIGWIPKEWVFATCSDVCEKVIDCKNRTPPITPEGHPVIRTPNVRYGDFVDDELVYTDGHSYVIWTARGKPQPGDIVITREAPVGEVCKIPERHPEACLGQRMMLYRTDPEKVVNDFFLYALQSNAVQNRLDLISGGSTVGHVRVGDIRSLWICYSESKAEQLNIADALNRMSRKLETESTQLSKLKMQKAGLMHDLLTGERPVKIAAEPAKAEAHV